MLAEDGEPGAGSIAELLQAEEEARSFCIVGGVHEEVSWILAVTLARASPKTPIRVYAPPVVTPCHPSHVLVHAVMSAVFLELGIMGEVDKAAVRVGAVSTWGTGGPTRLLRPAWCIPRPILIALLRTAAARERNITIFDTHTLLVFDPDALELRFRGGDGSVSTVMPAAVFACDDPSPTCIAQQLHERGKIVHVTTPR